MRYKYEAVPGEDIEQAAKNMVSLAEYCNAAVYCRFNGIDLEAGPKSDPNDIVRKYQEEIDRYCDSMKRT